MATPNREARGSCHLERPCLISSSFWQTALSPFITFGSKPATGPKLAQRKPTNPRTARAATTAQKIPQLNTHTEHLRFSGVAYTRKEKEEGPTGIGLKRGRQRVQDSLPCCLIRGHRVDGSAGDGLVTESLFDNREVDVLFHQRNAKRVLQAVWMPFILWQSGLLCGIGEDAIELRAVYPARFLRREDVLARMISAFCQPSP